MLKVTQWDDRDVLSKVSDLELLANLLNDCFNACQVIIDTSSSRKRFMGACNDFNSPITKMIDHANAAYSEGQFAMRDILYHAKECGIIIEYDETIHEYKAHLSKKAAKERLRRMRRLESGRDNNSSIPVNDVSNG